MPHVPQRPPLLVALYEQYLADQDTAGFIRRVSERYTPATLAHLVQSGHRLARRASVVALRYLGDYGANQVLGRALNDGDRVVRLLAEDGIRAVWERAGNSFQRAKLQIILGLVDAKKFKEAIRRATDLIEQAPWFAEAWNQRAIARFCLGQYAESLRDCRQALEINPYHFAAAAAMGQCHLMLEDPATALTCFRRALRLNPNLEGVRAQVVRLQKSLKDK